MKYIYMTEGRPLELEASPNNILAWRQAEQTYGKGGRLFREIPQSPEPVADTETLASLCAKR